MDSLIEEKDLKTFFLLGMWVGVVVSAVLVIMAFKYFGNNHDWYKEGQLDALTGKIKYELVTQDDSTRVWKEIK